MHVNGSVVTVALADGWAGEQLLDVIRGLYIHYPAVESTAQSAADTADSAATAEADTDPTDLDTRR